MTTTDHLVISRFEQERAQRNFGLIDPSQKPRFKQAHPGNTLVSEFSEKFKESSYGWFAFKESGVVKQIRLDNYYEGLDEKNEVLSIVKPLKKSASGLMLCLCIDMVIDREDDSTGIEIHHSEEDHHGMIVFEPEIGSAMVRPGRGNDAKLFASVISRAVATDFH